MSSSDFQTKTFSQAARSVTRGRSSTTKRFFDLALVALLLPIIVPTIAVIYLLTRLDGGAGFFGHLRVGKDNLDFRCWKIRSMVPNAEKVLEDYLAQNPAAASEWELDFKLADDPRVTRLGKFLRASSLDELPQIWNVLCGEMSFVGPRPVTRKEMIKYKGYEWCYLQSKPGITGLWQVSGRNDISYLDRVQLDVEYFDNRTLAKDIVIIFRTSGAILNRTGR